MLPLMLHWPSKCSFPGYLSLDWLSNILENYSSYNSLCLGHWCCKFLGIRKGERSYRILSCEFSIAPTVKDARERKRTAGRDSARKFGGIWALVTAQFAQHNSELNLEVLPCWEFLNKGELLWQTCKRDVSCWVHKLCVFNSLMILRLNINFLIVPSAFKILHIQYMVSTSLQ